MIGRTNTGGGGGLNFKVVGGTTAPSNPKENMIWINTNTPITDWVFSATQPTAASGRVWISTGTPSPAEFNALKKNGIQVYPLYANQYVSGAWVSRTAKIYQNSKWVTLWDGVSLYNKGDQCAHITGGWEETYQPGIIGVSPVFNADHIYFKTGSNTVCDLVTKKPVDLTGVSKIHMYLEDVSYTSAITSTSNIFISKVNNPPGGNNVIAVGTTRATHAELNVTSYDGLYYISVSIGNGVQGKITEIKWERG